MTTMKQFVACFGNLPRRRHLRLISRERDGYFALRLFAALVLAASSLHAHSLHQSSAEAEYNAKTKKLEVSLTVFINDLETALIRQSERQMRLDSTPAAEFDAQILAYLSQTFVVTSSSGKTAEIEWVGRQIDEETKKSSDPTVTLFFQLSLPDDLKGKKLKNAVFCELFKDQVNFLLLRSGLQKNEFRFVNDDCERELP